MSGHKDRVTKKHKRLIAESYTPIKNEKDIDNRRAKMIGGNYPASTTDCEVVGINGDCGKQCPVFLRGECENQGEIT